MPAQPRRASEKSAPTPRSSGSADLDATRVFWQPYANRRLTEEDAREITHNLLGFFSVLREWKMAARERSPESGTASSLRSEAAMESSAKDEILARVRI